MVSKSRWPWAMGLGIAVGAAWLAPSWLPKAGWWTSGQQMPAGAGALALSDVQAPAPSVAQMIVAMTPDQVRNRLFQEGSFVGTQPAGDWCVTPQQQLQPCQGLRQRIEYYLLGLGEVRIHDVRLLVQDEARRAHGDALTNQIMVVFDQYWKLRTHDWRHQFVQNDRSTWLPVFEEQRTVRRQILGQAWADAFFLDEEDHFQAYYAQFEGVSPLSPDQADASVAAWGAKLAAARQEWARLQDADHLSDPQRRGEMQRYVDSRFQGHERDRVKALLKL